MKKLIVSILCLCIALGYSCSKDTSAYTPQVKQPVNPAEHFDPDGKDGDQQGMLMPGINKIRLNVPMPDGSSVMREFKYYFPLSINPNKPISLLFNFHGSYTFTVGNPPPDPILNISTSDPLNRLADTANIVTVWPAGAVESGAVNWQDSSKHIPFVKEMISYFTKASPAIDPKRVYSCGQSSGAIFSYVLAYQMSNQIAAIAPVSGQMKLPVNMVMPARKVPIRAFNGTADDIVNHAAALNNIKTWAERIGGYPVKTELPLQALIKADTYNISPYKWNGGAVDIELYSVKDAGHGMNWTILTPLMWEFMRKHVIK